MQLVLLGGYDVTIYIIKANSDDETKRDDINNSISNRRKVHDTRIIV
jgi:hypothetical protein